LQALYQCVLSAIARCNSVSRVERTHVSAVRHFMPWHY
jgi:hypothetical protein